jgi:hypothetical protein
MNILRPYISPLSARPHYPPAGFPVVNTDEPLIGQSISNTGGQVFAWLASVPWNLAPPRPAKASAQNGAPAYSGYELGQAFSLNGSTNGLQFGNLVSLISGTGNLTFSFWIKTSGSTTGRIFGQWGSAAGDQNFLLSATTSQIELATKGTATIGQCRCSTALTANKLTHVAVVFTGANNMTFYYNGQPLSKTNTISGTSGTMSSGASGQFQLGYESLTSTAPITGLIDNFRIFTRSLNQSEILQLFADPFIGYSFGRSGVLSSIVGAAAGIGGSAKQYAVSVIS